MAAANGGAIFRGAHNSTNIAANAKLAEPTYSKNYEQAPLRKAVIALNAWQWPVSARRGLFRKPLVAWVLIAYSHDRFFIAFDAMVYPPLAPSIKWM